MIEVSNDHVQKWLKVARWAASGGNAQPWWVEYIEEQHQITIRLSIDRDYKKKASLMDVKGSASAVALGCLSMSLTILANNDGFELDQKLFQVEDEIWDSMVTLIFKRARRVESHFSDQDILSRKTDRHKYKTEPLPEELLQSISEIVKKYPVIQYREIVSNKDQLKSDLFEFENIRWQNKKLLASLLSEISLSKQERLDADKIPSGQLGISSMDRYLLRFLKEHPAFRSLLRWGVHRLPVRKIIGDGVKYCDRIYFLQVSDLNFRECFELGLCFQELWLEINRQNISFQPIGSPLIALGYWHDQAIYDFSPKHQRTLSQLTKNFMDKFSIDLKKPVLGFRVGWPSQNAEKGIRRELVGHQNDELVDIFRKSSSF